MKTYLVSGASSGIGRAVSLELAKDPQARVILLGRSLSQLKETQVMMKNSSQHSLVTCDVTDAKKMREEFGKLNLDSQNLAGVIANAGVGGPNTYGPEDRWQEVINTNLTGAYVLASEALPSLKKSKETFKHIIFISSILGKMGVPGYTAYCASKTGLLGLTRSLAVGLAQDNILVNAVCPGWVNTKMAKEGMDHIAKLTHQPFEQVYREQMGSVPLGKWSEPEEIAGLISYLMSPQQRSITGQALDINNGAFMSQ